MRSIVVVNRTRARGWRRQLAAITLIGLVLAGCGSAPADEATVAATTSTDTACPVDQPASTTTSSIQVTTRPPATPSSTTSSTAPPTPPQSLGLGDEGEAVVAAQRRLVELGFWLGDTSGLYDETTAHAVTAFEKLHDLDRDGSLSVEDLAILDRAEPPTPRTSSGHVVEIDIDHQVMLIVRDGTVVWVFDTSTGAVPGTTPVGWYDIYREIDGIRVSALGELYRPKYVVGGVAMHGYPDVPPQPASHGCIRLTNEAMDLIWALDLVPLGTEVFIYRG